MHLVINLAEVNSRDTLNLVDGDDGCFHRAWGAADAKDNVQVFLMPGFIVGFHRQIAD